jgi:hypothetical protein
MNQLTGILLMVSGGLITISQAGKGTGTSKRKKRPHPNFRKAKN